MTQEQPNPQSDKQEPPELKIPCEVYSRVVGYLRPIQNWNDGKQQEFADRQVFRAPGEDTGNRTSGELPLDASERAN